jgi:tRNA G10  N-methylase Trm11
MVALRGAEVLDPFVGKGSSVLPAIDLGLRPRGIECSQKHYDGLVFNVQQKYLSLNKACKFS